jgi:hypothetical protein
VYLARCNRNDSTIQRQGAAPDVKQPTIARGSGMLAVQSIVSGAVILIETGRREG